MIPAAFDYVRVGSVNEALTHLEEHGDEAKLLAGGHSLLPLMKLRLATPSVLVDVGRITELSYIRDEGDHVAIGALTRHHDIEHSALVAEEVPILAHVAGLVGDPQVRHRGTIGGSLAHADPAAELPAAAVALEATVIVEGPAGARRLACADLVDGYYSTSLQPGEIVSGVELPAAGAGQGAAFCEWAARAGDFAEAGVGVTVDVDVDGTCRAVRGAACGVASRPVGLTSCLSPLAIGAGQVGDSLLRAVAAAAETAAMEAGGSEDKAELTGLLAARALRRAWASAHVSTEEVAA